MISSELAAQIATDERLQRNCRTDPPFTPSSRQVDASTFDQFLDTLTSKDCGQLKDCYKCVSADLACAWVPRPQKKGRSKKTSGTCVESKTASFLDSAMLRGAPMSSSPSYTSRSQCGKKYDPQPHIYDGIMPPPPMDIAE